MTGNNFEFPCPVCGVAGETHTCCDQQLGPTELERLKAINAELLAAAIDIRDNPGTDAHGSVGFCAIENPKLERLAAAIAKAIAQVEIK